MSDHEHKFGKPEFKTMVMCSVEECTELRIGTKRGRWRELTIEETITAMAIMFEDIAVGRALQMIHGKERGLQRLQEVRGRKG